MKKRLLQKTIITLIISIQIIFIPSSLYAEHYIYKQLTIKERILTAIYSIYREENKYIWFGTKKGVYRYDGYESKHYSLKETQYTPNITYQLTPDSAGNFWAFTEKGLFVYDKENDKFKEVKYKDSQSISAFCYYMTKDGFFIGSTNCIYKYDYQTKKISIVKQITSSKRLNIQYIHLTPDKQKLLFCGASNNGVMFLNLKDGKIETNIFNTSIPISCFFIDSQQRIWIAGYNYGLQCFDQNKELLFNYTPQNSNLSNGIILCMAEIDHSLWIGTDGGGINILEPGKKEFEVLSHIPGNQHSLPANSIRCLYHDRYNNIWAGSVRDGIINIHEGNIQTFSDIHFNGKYGLSNPTVLSLLQDMSTEDHIWIGTDGEGLNCFHALQNEFIHYPQTKGMKIASIISYNQTSLLLSVYSKGLYLFNIQNNTLQPFNIGNKDINKQLKYVGKTINLHKENEQNIFLLSNQAYRYNLQNHEVQTLVRPHKERDAIILPITSTGGQSFLYDQQCIYKIDEKSTIMQEIFSMPQNAIIHSVSMDAAGNFWIASSNGIGKYSSSSKTYHTFPTSLFKEASSIICDNRGKVWIGANNMLFAYLFNQNNFAILGASDGVQPNEFLEKPLLQSTQGDIYMGGVKGLLRIDHNFKIDTTEVPHIILTDLKIDGTSIQTLPKSGNNIDFPWSSKELYLQTMSLEKDLFRSKIYRFTITGGEEQQLESMVPYISLRGLPTGRHSIYASCTTRNGEWTSPIKLIEVNVLPPWYKTWWFILVCVLLLVSAIIGIFIMLLRKKSNKLKWAMKEHEKTIYEQKVKFLINISHELRTPLTLIHAPLKRLLQQMQPQDANYITLQKIYRQSDRMKRLINMVLDLRKMEVGENKINIKPYNLHQWINEIFNDFNDECRALDITLKLETCSQPEILNFDKGKCEIILTNLLVNAMKHSLSNTCITIKYEQTDHETIRFSIADEGTGLTSKDLDKLFTRFYQGDEGIAGTGIGLSYSKMLVKLQGGTIGAYNNPGKGATFYFELPLHMQVEEQNCTPKAYLNELLAPELSPENITTKIPFYTQHFDLLLVDDSTELIDFLKESLQNKFHHIYTAYNGKEAIKSMKKNTPHIVVSDIMMPQMNGYELCNAIKQDIELSHIPVILLTARNEEQSQLEGYKLGADAFLSKPFDIETLYEIICSKLKIREDIKKRYSQATFISDPQNDTFSPSDETFMLKLNKIITEHISQPDLGIPFICNEIGMSRASLYNKLKAITDMGAKDYINKIKIEQAIHLIETTDLSFSEIADRTGFSTSRYFSTIFKQYTGFTPTQYRNEHKNQAQNQ